MFLTLWRKLFSPPPPAPPRIDLFDPEERLIYEHLCGFDTAGNKLFARKDPMVLWQRVMDQMGAIDADVKVARSPSKAAPKRLVDLIARLRAIFDVAPVDQGGLSDPLILQLFTHFMEYSTGLKKNSLLPTTSAQETFPDTPNSPDSEEESLPDTPNSSDSG